MLPPNKVHPKDQLHAAYRTIWHNLPSWPSTFGPCSCGRGNGRGSGPCIICGEEELAKTVGAEEAKGYVLACRHVRAIEKAHEKLLSK